MPRLAQRVAGGEEKEDFEAKEDDEGGDEVHHASDLITNEARHCLELLVLCLAGAW